MKTWLVSEGGERWSVKLDVRDLGGHLDSTYRVWGRTLAARVVAVLGAVWIVSALPLDYRGKFRILRTMYIPAALHGVEASLLSVLKLRAAFVRACWSSKLTLAHSGTVLGMLDGPEWVDPAACIVWFRFRMLRRYLAYRPAEVARIGGLLELVASGAPGHGPLHLLVDSAAGLGFQWCSGGFCCSRPGLPRLPLVDGPYQHFQAAVLDACRDSNSACFWIFEVLCSYFSLLISEIEIRHCFGEFFLGEFGMVFSLGKFREKMFRVAFVGVLMGIVICSGTVPILLWWLLGRVLSSIVLLIVRNRSGLGVCFDMVGFRLCLGLRLVMLGLRVLGVLLSSGWKLPWAHMLLRAIRMSVILSLGEISVSLRILLMFGLMVVWLLMKFLVWV